MVICSLMLPVTLCANNDSLAVATQEYFEHKAGDFFLYGSTSLDHFSDVTMFDVSAGYRKMVTDKRFYGGGMTYRSVESEKIVVLGLKYGTYFDKKYTSLFDVISYPFISGTLLIVSSDSNASIGIGTNIGSTIPLKGRFALTPSVTLAYAETSIIGIMLEVYIDTTRLRSW